ncbi:MAG: tRNA lysidine(34) synthetase TilS, partial [Opitutaceae bacterium]|nr:tRNA lysidine(34) synthetase TilS [Opitutaceae bacterium]
MKLSAATLYQRAAALGGLVPLTRWHSSVVTWAMRRRSRERWAVALSGGADSVALLLLLWAHFPERRGQLLVLHFNHRLRGRAADADEKFCRELCLGLGVEFEAARRATSDKVSNEAEARDLRFAFIQAAMRRHGAKALWLGHQLNDVAESMLMRLARGSGAGGLSAPRPVQVRAAGRVHLRALLNVRRSELEDALRQARLRWREDASNATRDYFRNRIRLDVLPAWTAAAGRDALAGA